MDRIGDASGSVHKYRIGAAAEVEQPCSLPDHASAIDEALRRLVRTGDESTGILASLADLAAVGFKTVHARDISGVVELDDEVIERKESYY